MNARTAAVFGLIAPLLYGGTVILGGALWPGYSQLSDPISLLASEQAPNTQLVNLLFVAYDILLFIFGLLWWLSRGNATRTSETAALALAVIGVLGILMYFFRQDAAGSPMSLAGTTHIVLAVCMSLLTMLAIFLRGHAEWRIPRRRGAAVFSFGALAVVVVSGGLAAVSIAQHWTFGGLFERCTIGAFLLWVFAEAWRLATHRGLGNQEY
jgi:hypothetical protein